MKLPKLSQIKSGGAWLALIVIIALLGGTHHDFFDVSNIRNVLGTNAELLVVAAGMTVVVISGGIDLSVGAMMAAAQLLLMELHGLPTALAIVIVLAFGFVAGALVNGVLIGIAKLNFFVVTLASMTFGYGIVLVITGGSTTTLSSNFLNQLGNSLVAGIPAPAVIFVVLLVILVVMLRRTTLGRAVYSIGGNAEASRLAGIPDPGGDRAGVRHQRVLRRARRRDRRRPFPRGHPDHRQQRRDRADLHGRRAARRHRPQGGQWRPGRDGGRRARHRRAPERG